MLRTENFLSMIFKTKSTIKVVTSLFGTFRVGLYESNGVSRSSDDVCKSVGLSDAQLIVPAQGLCVGVVRNLRRCFRWRFS